MELKFLKNKPQYDVNTISYCLRELRCHLPEWKDKITGMVVFGSFAKGNVVVKVTVNDVECKYSLDSFLTKVLVPKYAEVYTSHHTTESFNRENIINRTTIITIEAIHKAITKKECPYSVLETLIRTRLNTPLLRTKYSVFEEKR